MSSGGQEIDALMRQIRCWIKTASEEDPLRALLLEASLSARMLEESARSAINLRRPDLATCFISAGLKVLDECRLDQTCVDIDRLILMGQQGFSTVRSGKR